MTVSMCLEESETLLTSHTPYMEFVIRLPDRACLNHYPFYECRALHFTLEPNSPTHLCKAQCQPNSRSDDTDVCRAN